MAWDIKQNLQTGDLEWNSMRDLAGSEGLGLIQQRIHRRLVIERGEFIYDRTDTLGSRLRSLLNMGIPAASVGLEMIIKEALTPMKDISVTVVTIFTPDDGTGVVTDPNSVLARIEYELDLENADVSIDTSVEGFADVSIPF